MVSENDRYVWQRGDQVFQVRGTYFVAPVITRQSATPRLAQVDPWSGTRPTVDVDSTLLYHYRFSIYFRNLFSRFLLFSFSPFHILCIRVSKSGEDTEILLILFLKLISSLIPVCALIVQCAG